jgi:hypothetical protein
MKKSLGHYKTQQLFKMDPREGEVNEITGKECKYTANGK